MQPPVRELGPLYFKPGFSSPANWPAINVLRSVELATGTMEAPDSSEDEIDDVIDWEFDTPIPSWLQKAIKQHKSLTSQTDSSERFKLAKEPTWWRIIDASDPKISQDFLSETEFLELNNKISSALNIGNSVNDWTVLRPEAERCLQFLNKLDNNKLRKIGELVKPEGIHGAIVELMKMEMEAEESNSETDLFDGDDHSCGKASSTATTIEENDYLDKDSQKHELEKDLPWGREFSMCESKVDDDAKDILKTQKTLRDMHKSLVNAIMAESGGSLTKHVLRAYTELLMPGFVSKSFFIRAILIVYVGGS
ncbi:16529_t:CDS:2 [Acaulospora colombiana]|uniref:16529_t:CDS:1 n=1 Tax=Acaulospora colombiana TaxID=27376 RepID=A0ACA9LA11_9GLOM|nr:16529_t:CDS:2 [Acaulospora colombiana]